MKPSQSLRALIYVRVSTLEQAREGYSIKEQVDRLQSYAEAKGYTVLKVYRDPGYTGANLNRPGLQEMVRQVEKGVADVVLVYKLDRLSRSQRDTLHLIEDVFLKNEVDFVSMNESFDTSTPFGRAMIGILSVFAQLEREQIRERSMMGRQARAKSGRWHGGGGESRIVTGYDYEDGHLIINDYEAACIKFIFSEYEKGSGVSKIYLAVLERFPDTIAAETTVRNILMNPIYSGKIKYKDEQYEGLHKPIISEEQFNRVQQLIKKRTVKSDVFRKTYLLTGIIYCGQCGARMFGRTGGKLKDGTPMRYYVCYSRQGQRKHMVKDLNCDKKSERKEILEAEIIGEIQKLNIQTVKAHRQKESHTPNRIAVLENELKDIDKQLIKLIELYSLDNSPLDIISNKIEMLNLKRDKLQEHVKNLEAEFEEIDLGDVEETVSQLSTFDWDSEETDKKRLLVAKLINKIIVSNDNITIEWGF